MNVLTLADRGTFHLSTRSGSTYELVLNHATATMRRLPAAISPSTDHDAVPLRKDDEEVAIIAIVHAEEGHPGFFILEPLSDNGATATTRRTTPIVSIERA